MDRLIKKLVLLLEARNIKFDRGLSESELKEIEEAFAVRFPDDLKAFLQTGLPVSDGFVRWRYGLNSKKGRREIEKRLDWPKQGILLDVKEGHFWLKEWGVKPKYYEEQEIVVSAHLEASPKLIPVYSHRYIPSDPSEMGNPIFSVYQTDIIYYGFDLADYLLREFKIELTEDFGKMESPQKIEFWSKMVERNGSEK